MILVNLTQHTHLPASFRECSRENWLRDAMIRALFSREQTGEGISAMPAFGSAYRLHIAARFSQRFGHRREALVSYDIRGLRSHGLTSINTTRLGAPPAVKLALIQDVARSRRSFGQVASCQASRKGDTHSMITIAGGSSRLSSAISRRSFIRRGSASPRGQVIIRFGLANAIASRRRHVTDAHASRSHRGSGHSGARYTCFNEFRRRLIIVGSSSVVARHRLLFASCTAGESEQVE